MLWLEDPFPQGPEGPAQLSRVFIPPVGLLLPLQYFSWGPAGGRRRGFAGAKAFGTSDQTSVREPYDFAVAEAHIAGVAGQPDLSSFVFPCVSVFPFSGPAGVNTAVIVPWRSSVTVSIVRSLT